MKLKAILCILPVILFSGCKAVLSEKSVGLTPKDLGAEVENWEGIWKSNELFLTVFVKDSSNGVLRVAMIDQSDDETKTECFDVQIKDADTWTFATKLDDAASNPFIWGRIKTDGRFALIWLPDFEKFKPLIESGTLPGSVNKDNVVLGPLGTNHYDIICSDTNPVLFNWDEPIILQKISK